MSYFSDADLKSRYREVKRPDLVISPRSGVLPLHRAMLFEKIGYGPHLCHHCGDPINWRPGRGGPKGALVVDHLDNNSLNNDPANLVPSCHRCNCRKERTDLVRDGEPFRVDADGYRHRVIERSCAICGATFGVDPCETRPNRGIYCSRSCARRAPRRRAA